MLSNALHWMVGRNRSVRTLMTSAADSRLWIFSAAEDERSPRGFESPTPIVFVCGEGLGAQSWKTGSDLFTHNGYNGLVVELPFSEDKSVDNLVDGLHKHIQAAGLVPPVMIAHSMSSFVAQKYLESYSLAALVLVNPLPPDPRTSVRSLYSWWNDCCTSNSPQLSSYSAVLSKYYCCDGEKSGIQCSVDANENNAAFPVSAVLMRDLLDDKATLRLEPGSVPILVVMTNAVAAGLPDTDLAALMGCHGLQTEDVICLPCSSRVPMFVGGKDSQDVFYNYVLNWIDSIV